MQTYNIDKKMIEIINNGLIDEDSLIDYILREIERKHYSNCLSHININAIETLFDQFNRILWINYKQTLEEANKLFRDSFLKIDNKDKFINIWLLFIVIHEMEHIKQRSYFEGGAKNYLEDFICQEINFSTTEISDDVYSKFHDCFLYERIATFSSFGSIFNMFSKTSLNKELYNWFVKCMFYYLQKDYQITEELIKSPLEFEFELIGIKNKSQIKSKSRRLIVKKHMSDIEKAQYGLPLKKSKILELKRKSL